MPSRAAKSLVDQINRDIGEFGGGQRERRAQDVLTSMASRMASVRSAMVWSSTKVRSRTAHPSRARPDLGVWLGYSTRSCKSAQGSEPQKNLSVG